jgi:hypothetical protein
MPRQKQKSPYVEHIYELPSVQRLILYALNNLHVRDTKELRAVRRSEIRTEIKYLMDKQYNTNHPIPPRTTIYDNLAHLETKSLVGRKRERNNGKKGRTPTLWYLRDAGKILLKT